ncbi:MAG: twin-arginine translocase TatA/TatE family subunit [Lentisphaerae bacterium]|nr:twin-arginine translocase TatA/TatE family subunit [Lentisphaerota bacterium]
MLFGVSQLAYIGPGAPELIVVALVLLMLFGSKDAPRIFRKMNQTLGRLRNTAESFKHEILYGDLKDDEPHRIGAELESDDAPAAFHEDEAVSDADEGDDAKSA